MDDALREIDKLKRDDFLLSALEELFDAGSNIPDDIDDRRAELADELATMSLDKIRALAEDVGTSISAKHGVDPTDCRDMAYAYFRELQVGRQQANERRR